MGIIVPPWFYNSFETKWNKAPITSCLAWSAKTVPETLWSTHLDDMHWLLEAVLYFTEYNEQWAAVTRNFLDFLWSWEIKAGVTHPCPIITSDTVSLCFVFNFSDSGRRKLLLEGAPWNSPARDLQLDYSFLISAGISPIFWRLPFSFTYLFLIFKPISWLWINPTPNPYTEAYILGRRQSVLGKWSPKRGICAPLHAR